MPDRSLGPYPHADHVPIERKWMKFEGGADHHKSLNYINDLMVSPAGFEPATY
jgi:hypothetical protein